MKTLLLLGLLFAFLVGVIFLEANNIKKMATEPLSATKILPVAIMVQKKFSVAEMLTVKILPSGARPKIFYPNPTIPLLRGETGFGKGGAGY